MMIDPNKMSIDDCSEAIIHKLRDMRERKGMTVTKLADETGIIQSNLTRLETLRVNNPKIKTVLKYLQSVGGKIIID